MKKQGIVKRAVKKVADVPSYMDTASIRYTWNSMRRAVGQLCRPRQSSIHESFEEALLRLNLTEADVQLRTKEFSRLAIIFMLMAAASFIYSIYNAAVGSISGFLLGFVVTLIVLCRAIYFHFWLFQLKHRKLGCSLKEWFNSSISGGVKPPKPVDETPSTEHSSDITDTTHNPPTP